MGPVSPTSSSESDKKFIKLATMADKPKSPLSSGLHSLTRPRPQATNLCIAELDRALLMHYS